MKMTTYFRTAKEKRYGLLIMAAQVLMYLAVIALFLSPERGPSN